MIDSPEQPMEARLSPMRCGRCNWPVCHVNRGLPGEGKALCTRCKVYTYYLVIAAAHEPRAP